MHVPPESLRSVGVGGAYIGQAPAPPGPDALVAAVVVAIRERRGEEEPVVEPVVPKGKPGMSHSSTCERRTPDSDAVNPRTHAGHANGANAAAHADAAAAHAHSTVTHATHPAVATHPGRRVERRSSDDRSCGGQGDYDLTHHDCVLQLVTERTSSLSEPRRWFV